MRQRFDITLFYLGFFALIGFTVWWTKSPYPLFALILTPDWDTKEDNNGPKKTG